MALRISIMLDEDVGKKLRLKQAKLIKKTKGAISFSQVLNQTLKKSLN